MKTETNNLKRRKILTAAVDLFSRTHDVKKLSLDAIIRAARVSPTTVYNNFGNRETLVFEVVKELMKSNLERYRAVMRSDISFPQKLATIMGGKLEMVDKVNVEILEKLTSSDKEMAPFVDKIVEEEIKPLWGEMIDDGKKQGYIDSLLDNKVLIIYLDVIKAGFMAKPELMQGIKGNTEMIKQLSRLMFYGFLKKDIGLFGKEGK